LGSRQHDKTEQIHIEEHMKKPWRISKFFRIFILIFSFTNCASQPKPIFSDVYLNSNIEFRLQNIPQTIAAHPDPEALTFQTGLELAWLHLLTKKADLDLIEARFPDSIWTGIATEENSFRYSISRDGYVIAEHEIIVAALVLAMAHSSVGRVGDAKKYADFALNYFMSDKKSFDDPVLKIWLGTVLLITHDWTTAKIQFKEASNLLKSDEHLKFLASREIAPQKISLLLSGPGPKVKWTGNSEKPFEFYSDFAHPEFQKRPLIEVTKHTTKLETLNWWVRLSSRNHILSNRIDSLKNLEKVSSTATANIASGVVSASSFFVKGIAIATGVGITAAGYYYLLQESKTPGGVDHQEIDSELSFLPPAVGFLSGMAIWNYGNSLGSRVKNIVESSKENEGRSRAHDYQYVRFLPDELTLYSYESPGAAENSDGNFLTQAETPVFLEGWSKDRKTKISFHHTPSSQLQKKTAQLEEIWVDPITEVSWSAALESMVYEEAKEACHNLQIGIAPPWRLPKWEELISLYKHRESETDARYFRKAVLNFDRVWLESERSPSSCNIFETATKYSRLAKNCEGAAGLICIRR
jgi:hypothetical protein